MNAPEPATFPAKKTFLSRFGPLIGFALSAPLAVWLGFFALKPVDAIFAVGTFGLYFMIATFLIFLGSVYMTLRPWLATLGERPWKRLDWAAVATILVCWLMLITHEPWMCKVVWDEPVQIATSMNMHLNNQIGTPSRAYYIEGAFSIMQASPDKRPYFYPFVVTLLHKLVGYNWKNAVYANVGLGLVLLTLAYGMGRALGDRRGGILAVLLITGVPLVSQYVTSGGQEILNLVMILAVALLAIHYLKRRDGWSLNAFVYGALLLAQSRYESVLFIAPVALIVFLGWALKRKVLMTWFTALAPLMLLPYPWLNEIFEVGDSATTWQIAEGKTAAFSFQNLVENYEQAVGFFSDYTFDGLNSLILTGLGAFGLLFLVILLKKRFRTLLGKDIPVLVTALFVATICTNFFLLLTYHWGALNDFVVLRLALPLHVGLMLAVVAVLPELTQNRTAWRLIILVAAVYIPFHTISRVAQSSALMNYGPARETAVMEEWIRREDRRECLVIAASNQPFLINHVPGIGLSRARHRAAAVRYHMLFGTFKAVYVFQGIAYEPSTNKWEVYSLGLMDQRLPENYVLETLEEHRLHAMRGIRISRLVEVKPYKRPAAQKDEAAASSPDKATSVTTATAATASTQAAAPKVAGKPADEKGSRSFFDRFKNKPSARRTEAAQSALGDPKPVEVPEKFDIPQESAFADWIMHLP